ncbi:MAG: ankyrin repeat domain-containing protein [Planctomycetes bacterium]|nr:ankyrin repeat domain-containing protein [Planctomycetota bacterium]
MAVASVVLVGCSRDTTDNTSVHDALAEGDEASLRRALEHGADANELNQDGMTPLHVTITKQDVAATRILLEYGAKLDIPNSTGQTALEAALLGAVGSDLLEATRAAQSKGPDDPSVQVVSAIMHVVRRESSNDVDMKGNLAVTLEMAGRDASGIMHVVSRVTFESQGKAYVVKLSRWETEYIGLDKSGEGSAWSIVLRIGEVYRIVGTQKDGEIETTLLALEEPPKDENNMVLPLANWLPSTRSAIHEHTWLGAFSNK